MRTKSKHTKQNRQRGYVSATSRNQRNAATFVAQLAAYVEAIDAMAGTDQPDTLDIARGQRIKARREELHLTQPAVVDLIEKAAYQLPRSHDLHPDQAGKAPVTLRGYQTYERGGGIVWEKAKLLADVLGLDVRAMMNGHDQGPTPDPFPEPAVTGELAQILADIKAQLAEQTGVLEEIRGLLGQQQEAAKRADESARRLEAAVSAREEQVRQALRAGTEDPASTAQERA